MLDDLSLTAQHAAAMGAAAIAGERAHVRGDYTLVCTNAHGEVLWREDVENTVVTAGQNQLLTNGLSTAAYMLLISSVGFTAIAAADTMASHPGWNEADSTNAPAYSGNRPSVTFGTPAGGSATITPVSFVFTGSGTIEGIAMVFGTGAAATPGNTSGVLLSAGTLSAAQPVISGNTVTASYTLGL